MNEAQFTLKDMLLIVITSFVLMMASYFLGMHEGLRMGQQKAEITQIENVINNK